MELITHNEPCRALFQELASDNLQTAKRLSEEIREVGDVGAERDMGKRILAALHLSCKFKNGAEKLTDAHHAEEC